MLVIFSAFKTGLDESGRTSCELKRAWDVSEHSERFPSQAKCPRSNTPREAMEPRLNGKTDGRPCSQRGLLGALRLEECHPALWWTHCARLSLPREPAFQPEALQA